MPPYGIVKYWVITLIFLKGGFRSKGDRRLSNKYICLGSYMTIMYQTLRAPFNVMIYESTLASTYIGYNYNFVNGLLCSQIHKMTDGNNTS